MMTKLTEVFKKWGLKVNNSKTNDLLTAIVGQYQHIEGHKIEVCKERNYLGVVLRTEGSSKKGDGKQGHDSGKIVTVMLNLSFVVKGNLDRNKI